MITQFVSDLKCEFKGYNGEKLVKDLMAGLTVTAVALPLALAFGVSAGADAAAGLISAIIAGLVIGTLSGASYQVSGPTGTMMAILFTLSVNKGVESIFIVGLLSGILLLIAAAFRFGRFVSFIPSPVVTGFTSGIAIIIALSQVDNFFGTTSVGENAVAKLLSYGKLGFSFNVYAVLIGLLVIAIMVFWPKKWNTKFPASLASIIIALVINSFLDLPVKLVGEIPRTLLPINRLTFSNIPFNEIINFIGPAFSVATLIMIESLLCGASAGKIKNEKLNADRELIAQGIGNIVIPFFGGIPASAVLARTSVSLKSGGQTRLVCLIQSLGLIISIFILGPFISKIPMAALAGVLIITSWRMNEWNEIKYIFSNKFGASIIEFVVTMVATVIFNLTIAILVGVLLAILLFVIKHCELNVEVSDVDIKRIKGYELKSVVDNTKIIYLTGPLFFITKNKLNQTIEHITDANSIIFSVRAVTSVDESAISELKEFVNKLAEKEVKVLFCGVQPNVKAMFDKSGLTSKLGNESFCWDAIEALKYLESEQLTT